MKIEKENLTVDTNKLKPNPLSLHVYGEEGPDFRLIESIEEKGQLEPLVIIEDKEDPENFIIISGHRRWMALKQLGKKANCRLVLLDELEMKEVVIEYNKYRNKKPSQIVNEANLLKLIYAEKAEKRRNSTLKQNADVQNSAQREEMENDAGRTRDKVADAVGIGRDKLEKFTKIKEKADSGDEEAIILMKQLDNEEITANRAITYLELIEASRSNTPEKDYAVKLIYQIKKEKITPFQALTNLNSFRKKIAACQEDFAEDIYIGKYPVLFADFTESFPPLEDYMHLNLPLDHRSVLCILTKPQFLKDALDVLDWFGFTFKSMCVWDRDINSSDAWFTGSFELLLLGITQVDHPPHVENHFPSIIKDKNAHKCVHEMIKKMFPNQKYIDLFPKKEHDEWDRWVLDVKSIYKESIESKLNKLFEELDQNESVKRIIMSKSKQDATEDPFEEWY